MKRVNPGLLLLSLYVFVTEATYQIRDFQEGSPEAPTEEEIQSRNDMGFGKPRKFREENNVLILTDTNMEVALNQYDFLLVEFYAPWCGHCKKLAPHYSAAATELYDEEVQLGKVDCTTSKKLHNRYKIEGFPTMHFFKYGKQIPYTGGNKKDQIVAWVRRHAAPSAANIPTLEALKSQQELLPVMVVGYFPSSSSSSKLVDLGQKAFFQSAEHKDHLNFFQTTSAEVAQHLGLAGDGVTVLKKFDEERQVLSFADFDDEDDNVDDISEAVVNFVTSMTYPLVSVFSKEKAREIFAPKIMTHVLVFTDPDAEHHGPTITAATKVAKDFRGTAQIISVEAQDENILRHFQVDAGTLPAVVVMDVDLMERFPFSSESGAAFHDESVYDELVQHVQAVVDRDL